MMTEPAEGYGAWDLVIVGGGPAGSAAALGALSARPDLAVLILDRADFPRDKACGDGIAPHVLDVLASVGVTGLLDDLPAITSFSLRHKDEYVAREMRRPVWVVPRTVFDHRLVEAATAAGAVLRRHRVREAEVRSDGVVVDRDLRAPIVVAADGAHSVMRSVAGLPPVARRALAIRGYAPTPPSRQGRQAIVFGERRQPSYAWSFDRGDGVSNIGYGELLDPDAPVSRADLLARLELLLPGARAAGTDWRAHHLPLSSRSWQHPGGRILLTGDAAGLINPMTGEGIYYAVATGVLAGRAAAAALSTGTTDTAGARYRRGVQILLGRHLRHTAVASRLASVPAVVSAGVRAAAAEQRAFDALVEVGLGQGLLTPRLVSGLIRRVRWPLR